MAFRNAAAGCTQIRVTIHPWHLRTGQPFLGPFSFSTPQTGNRQPRAMWSFPKSDSLPCILCDASSRIGSDSLDLLGLILGSTPTPISLIQTAGKSKSPIRGELPANSTFPTAAKSGGKARTGATSKS
jgi:hypothetical protein